MFWWWLEIIILICSCQNIVSCPNSEFILIKSTHFSFSPFQGFSLFPQSRMFSLSTFSLSGLRCMSPKKLSLMAQLKCPQSPPHLTPALQLTHETHQPACFFLNTYNVTSSRVSLLIVACPPAATIRVWVSRTGSCLSCFLRSLQFLSKCPACGNHSIHTYWMNKRKKNSGSRAWEGGREEGRNFEWFVCMTEDFVLGRKGPCGNGGQLLCHFLVSCQEDPAALPSCFEHTSCS